MSELRVETYRMPAACLGAGNPLPPLDGCMPHRLQDNYDRVRKAREFKAVVLENEFLRATFLTELGGRLWSLFHKPSNQELLYVNPVFQPANLAIRNAWFSGGVEWNVAVRGHTAYTCSPLFAARVQGDDSLPVLRMYEWDRVRMMPYQIDAFIPDGSMFMFVRVRLINPHEHEIPMYWWSNIAFPETSEVRVLSPAEQAYKYGYQGKMIKVPIPISDGIDLSYPRNYNRSADCFYCIDADQQPWITALDGQGRGLIHTSTGRLRGRKLFVWGMGPGGRHWQEFLSVPGSPYIEIQAGLARTQSEYLPMPAGAEWTWLEAYGLMEAEPEVVLHSSDWRKAYKSVDKKLKEILPQDLLESKLLNSNGMADKPPDEIIQQGSGWGSLERRRRERSGEKPFCPPSMDFNDDSLGVDQDLWLALLEDGALPYTNPTDLPGAWMVQSEWRQLLEDSVNAERSDHWLAWLHLGVMYYDKDIDAARRAWEKSLALEPSPWAYRNMAVLEKHEGRLSEAADLLLTACQMAPQIHSLVLECCQTLLKARRPQDMLNFMDKLPRHIHDRGRMQIMKARAALMMDDLQKVQEILESRPSVSDIREGEITLSNLWFEMHEKRIAATENVPIDDELRQRVRRDYPPPSWLDFRQAT